MRLRHRLSFGIPMLLIILGCDMAGAASGDLISPSLSLSVENHRLTVHIDKVPLREVLEILIEKVPITITIKGFEGENPISATFTDFPLVKGIERLLQGQDYALLYARPESGTQTSGQARLVEIFVLPREHANSSTTSIETQVVLSPEIPGMLTPTKDKRNVLEGFGDQAFESADSSDRVTTAEQLKDRSLPVLSLASRDQDPEVRATAIALLPVQEGTGSVNLLKEALKDSDPDIRELAEVLLQELEGTQK